MAVHAGGGGNEFPAGNDAKGGAGLSGRFGLLHAVKAVGANASEDKSAGLGRRRLLLAMMDYYERTYGGEHGVRVTYDLLYISGVRQPRP